MIEWHEADRMRAMESEPGVEPSEVSVVPGSDQKTLEWITVLSAARLDYRLSLEPWGWTIHLPSASADGGIAEIESYERAEAQNAVTPASLAASFLFPPDVRGLLWVSILVIGCYFLFGPASSATPAVVAGAADSARIRDGEWWRVVTALMLHANGSHLGGNMFGLLFLGYILSRVMGVGLGWFLVLASGAVGNLVAAGFAPAERMSVGASTAVFGALGLLVGHRAVRILVIGDRAGWGRRDVFIPVGAGLSLLTMWGASPGSDVIAHLTGFAAGLMLAAPFSIREFDWMKGGVQAFLGWVSVSVAVGAWGLAGMWSWR